MYAQVSLIVDVKKHHRKTMNFDVWQMVDPTKLGVGLSGTITSHKTLTLVVGMTMILDDFLRQCMLQKAIILF